MGGGAVYKSVKVGEAPGRGVPSLVVAVGTTCKCASRVCALLLRPVHLETSPCWWG